MLKHSKIVLMAGLLLLFFSCGRSKNSTSSVTAQSESRTISGYSGDRVPKQDSFDDPAIQRFSVPPEIATMQANVYATGSSFAEAATLIDTHGDKVIKSFSAVKGCSASIDDYQHPKRRYGKTVLSDTATYSSRLQIEMIVSFDGTNNVRERIKQLNLCLQAIPQLKLETSNKNTKISLNVSDAVPTVKNVDRYRQQILDSKFARLKEISNLAETPSQFEASETKCTSNGILQISDRSLREIELDINFSCLQFNK